MPIRRLLTLFTLGLALLAPPAAAQEVVTKGDKVRAEQCTEPGRCTRVQGEVIGFEADSLLVQRRTGISSIPWTAGDSIQVSQGRRNHAGTGAVVGAVVGVLTGGVVAGICSGLSDGECNEAYYIAGGSGLVLGTAVGALIRTDKWKTLQHPGSRAALRHGAQLALYVGRASGVGLHWEF